MKLAQGDRAYMSSDDQDVADILAVIEADVQAYLAKDFDALAANFLPEDRLVSIMQIASSGLIRSWGFDGLMATMRAGLAVEGKQSNAVVTRTNERVTVRGDMAWAFFDQTISNSDDPTDPPGFSHNVRVFERHNGRWLIAFHGVFEPTSEGVSAPMIEVDRDGRVLTMNAAAEDRIGPFPGLTVSHGKLRASRPDWDKALQAAIGRAADLSTYSVLHNEVGRGQRPEFPVVLGEDDEGGLLVCLVSVTDFSVTVSFENAAAFGRRLQMARMVYGLSEAQVEVATEIADGHDLAGVADRLGITVNTARTHLRRMFDKTGVRSQTALMRVILSLG